jgi:hypothetical protein
MAKGSRAKNLKAKDVGSKQASRVKGGGYAANVAANTSETLVTRASQPTKPPTFPKP